MAKYTWDHIHLRTPNPEAMAQWFEQKLGAEVIRTEQQGKTRIDLKLGGANIFIAPVETGDGVNAAPTTPYRGLDHFGLSVSGIDAIAAGLKAKGVEFTREPTTVRPGTRGSQDDLDSASSATSSCSRGRAAIAIPPREKMKNPVAGSSQSQSTPTWSAQARAAANSAA